MDSRRRRLLDQQLDHAAADLLAHDLRLRGLDVAVRFDGGVAHVSGNVLAEGEAALLRELLGRLAGVHAVWDHRLRVAGRPARVVDLGCGATKQHPENLGFDITPRPGVDVVTDLRHGVPLREASVDHVFAVHVLEHLADYIPLLDDCHRVLRPDGVLHVLAPWWGHVNAVADPTHVRLFDTQTLKHFCLPGSGARCWHPLHLSRDEATVFADLLPVKDGERAADELRLARFFD